MFFHSFFLKLSKHIHCIIFISIFGNISSKKHIGNKNIHFSSFWCSIIAADYMRMNSIYKYAPFSYSYGIGSSVFSNFPYHFLLFFNFFPFFMFTVFILISDILYEYAWWYAFGILQMSMKSEWWNHTHLVYSIHI